MATSPAPPPAARGAHRTTAVRGARRIATMVVAASLAASVLAGCGPRLSDPPMPSPSSTSPPVPSPTPSPSDSPVPTPAPTPPGPAPAPDATIPESPEDAAPDDGAGGGSPEVGPRATPAGSAPSEACPDALTTWIVDESQLIADDRTAEPAPSDPAVDFAALSEPGCAFAGKNRSFTDIEEVEATSDVRVWVFTDAVTAAAHAQAALDRLIAAGYAVFDRRGGSDALTHLLRGAGSELLDQAVVQTWGAVATARRVGAEPGQVVVAVGVVTFAGLG